MLSRFSAKGHVELTTQSRGTREHGGGVSGGKDKQPAKQILDTLLKVAAAAGNTQVRAASNPVDDDPTRRSGK